MSYDGRQKLHDIRQELKNDPCDRDLKKIIRLFDEIVHEGKESRVQRNDAALSILSTNLYNTDVAVRVISKLTKEAAYKFAVEVNLNKNKSWRELILYIYPAITYHFGMQLGVRILKYSQYEPRHG